MRKVCRKCKIFVTGSECPICKGKDLTESWRGIVIVLDPKESEIAEKLNIKVPGKYAIKVG